jgi:hypothetical protein
MRKKIVNFCWVPSYVGISGNKRVDHLAFSTKSHINISSFKLPSSDILPIHHKLFRNAWQSKWDSLPPYYATWHRKIISKIPRHPWFKDLDLSRRFIVSFTRLWLGYSLLPYHPLKLDLNSSPLCTLHQLQTICDFEQIIFNCPTFSSNRLILFSLFSSLGYISPDSNLLLNSRSIPIIQSIINFILITGFLV